MGQIGSFPQVGVEKKIFEITTQKNIKKQKKT